MRTVTDRNLLWSILVLHLAGAAAILYLVLTLSAATERQVAIRNATMERLLELDGRMRRIERNLGLPAIRDEAPAPGGR